MRKLKTNLATNLIQPTSVAEFPVKGSGLTPLIPLEWVEVLCEALVD